MVKGISRQVIVVPSPDRELFEQAIFILKENAVGEGVSEETLLKQAHKAINMPERRSLWLYGVFWAGIGAAVTGIAWLVTVLI